MIWQEPKDADVTDNYGFVLDPDWLDGETLTSVVFTAPVESGLIIQQPNPPFDGQISALFSGGNEGFWSIHIRLETATRQREMCMTLWVKQGC